MPTPAPAAVDLLAPLNNRKHRYGDGYYLLAQHQHNKTVAVPERGNILAPLLEIINIFTINSLTKTIAQANGLITPPCPTIKLCLTHTQPSIYPTPVIVDRQKGHLHGGLL